MPLDVGSIEVVEGNTVVEIITPTETGPAGPPGPQGPPGTAYDNPYQNVAASAIVTINGGTIFGDGPTARGYNDYWETTAQDTWVKLNLEQAYNIGYIIFGTRMANDLSQTPETFTVEYSLDDISYFNVETVTDNDATLQIIIANAISAQYIRITANTFQPLSASVKIAGLMILTENNPAFAGSRLWEMLPGTNNVFLNTSGMVGIGTTDITAELTVNGDITASGIYTSTSDVRLKKNMQPIESALDKICKLHGFYFDWKEMNERNTEQRHLILPQGRHLGLSAQEMINVFPELVVDRGVLLHIDEIGLIPAIVEAIKELRNMVEIKR